MSRFLRRNDKFARRTTYASHKGQYLQVDLVDLSKQDAGYIMNGIDVFSRMAESVKLTSKNQSEIQRGLNQIFSKLGTPEKLQSDLESGIYSDATQTFLESKNVTLFTVANSYNGKNSAPIVERLQKTQKDFFVDLKQKEKLNFKQTAVKVALEFPNYYNNKVHSFLKMPPIQASQQEEKTKAIQIGNLNIKKPEPKVPLKIGDKVRLQKPKETIKGKFEEQFYPYEYQIVEVRNTNPTTYKLKVLSSDRKDEIGLILDASYYKQQLKLI